MPPLYEYSNPDDESNRIVLLQSMHESHSYTVAGVEWNRVWTAPQIGIDTKIDCNDEKKFLTKTEKGGKLGDIWDLSAEMSAKRAEKMGGVDPLKAEADKKYSDARGGKAKRGKQAKPSRDIVIE
jgi:hypothetical protein